MWLSDNSNRARDVLNPRIVLLFLRTRIVLGVKTPTGSIRKQQMCFFQRQTRGMRLYGEFSDSVRNDFDKDGQPEVAIWLTKPEILWAALIAVSVARRCRNQSRTLVNSSWSKTSV